MSEILMAGGRSLLFFCRHDQGPNGEIVSRFTDRAVPDRAVRARIALGRRFLYSLCLFCTSFHLGSFNARTNRNSYRAPETVDDMARRYMYTSAQQAASDEVAWGKIMPTLRSSINPFLSRFENAG